MASQIVTLVVNDRPRELIATPGMTLLEALREPLGLMAAKRGCAQGSCGTCTVLLDGEPVVSCLVPVETVDGDAVATLEGVADGQDLDDVQEAFLDSFATQCGFCTPGMIMSAQALLDRNPTPDREDVAEAISGNVCRCTGYASIIDAILDAADRRAGGAAAGADPVLAGNGAAHGAEPGSA